MNWESAKESVVALTDVAGAVLGTGFFLSREGHPLTCAHVVQAAGGYEGVRIAGQPVHLVYLGDPVADDFAILQLPGYQGTPAGLSLQWRPLSRFLTMGFGRPDFPQGASIDGVLTDINPQADFGGQPMLRLRIFADAQEVRPGYSGAPVFDTDAQRVVGMIAAYDHSQGALALPLTAVRDRWPGLQAVLESTAPPRESVSEARTPPETARIFISYRSQDPDLSLAQQFYEELRQAGYHAFMAGESIRMGENWPQRIDEELQQCDYFLLLLSPLSVASEMVTEEVRRARHLQDTRPGGKPVILPVRVNLPFASDLTFDLSGYLSRIQQSLWSTPADTPRLLRNTLDLIGRGTAPAPAEARRVVGLTEDSSQAPVPVASPELPRGRVGPASKFYVERPPIEADCYEYIAEPRALIHIRAPRQTGKTSLLARILVRAEEYGHRKVSVSFQQADESVFSGSDPLLRWFSTTVSDALDLPAPLDEYWGARDPVIGCSRYFRQHILPKTGAEVTLGLDEVDAVFQNPKLAMTFFGMLRSWNDDFGLEIWSRLRMIIVHSTEAYLSLDVNHSPFNVGMPITLPDFTPDQVHDLARRHGLPWQSQQVQRLCAIVGGQPYLVRLALYHIARGRMQLEDLEASAATDAGIYGDHLRRLLWILEQHPELARAMGQVLKSRQPVVLETEEGFKIESMGAGRRQGNGIVPRCELYRHYLNAHLRSAP